MRRRAFIAGLGSAVAWPLVARGQQAIPNIGFLGSQSAEGLAPMLQGFRKGLEEGGFREGTNVVVDYRWAHNEIERLPALAQELVALHPRVIASTGGSDALVAAKAATSSIPIVFVSGVDPVETGIVPNLNAPGGNITGVTFFIATLLAKRLEILQQAVPSAKVFGILLDPRGPDGRAYLREIRTLQSQGQDFIIATATTPSELDAAFANLAAKHVDALLFAPGPFFRDHRDILIANLERLRLPAISSEMFGGHLLSYGPSIPEAYRVCGFKITRILLRARPADLPIEQSTKLILTINLKTAKAFGLVVPSTLLARADEVIE